MGKDGENQRVFKQGGKTRSSGSIEQKSADIKSQMMITKQVWIRARDKRVESKRDRLEQNKNVPGLHGSQRSRRQWMENKLKKNSRRPVKRQRTQQCLMEL